MQNMLFCVSKTLSITAFGVESLRLWTMARFNGVLAAMKAELFAVSLLNGGSSGEPVALKRFPSPYRFGDDRWPTCQKTLPPPPHVLPRVKM